MSHELSLDELTQTIDTIWDSMDAGLTSSVGALSLPGEIASADRIKGYGAEIITTEEQLLDTINQIAPVASQVGLREGFSRYSARLTIDNGLLSRLNGTFDDYGLNVEAALPLAQHLQGNSIVYIGRNADFRTTNIHTQENLLRQIRNAFHIYLGVENITKGLTNLRQSNDLEHAFALPRNEVEALRAQLMPDEQIIFQQTAFSGETPATDLIIFYVTHSEYNAKKWDEAAIRRFLREYMASERDQVTVNFAIGPSWETQLQNIQAIFGSITWEWLTDEDKPILSISRTDNTDLNSKVEQWITEYALRYRDMNGQNYMIRPLSITERRSPETVQMYMQLYARFGWQVEDVIRLLANPDNLFVGCFTLDDDDNELAIVSSGIAEFANLPVAGQDSLRVAEITEAATAEGFNNRGLYTRVVECLARVISTNNGYNHIGPVDMAYGETNATEPAVQYTSARKRRIPAELIMRYLGRESGLIDNHAFINGSLQPLHPTLVCLPTLTEI